MTSISKPTASSLSLSTKIGWGFADAGINVFVFLKSVMILNFMTTYLGVNALIAGVVTSLVILTDMITDPLVGAWSDRMDSRWGRRRPFMAIGAFLMLALTYGTFAVPSALPVYQPQCGFLCFTLWPALVLRWWRFPLALWPQK